MLEVIQNGPDYTSLFGSNIAENSLFYFVSANGYNIFNGVVWVYYKTMTLHSKITSPELLNTNFGFIVSANDEYIAVGGISYDVYSGAIFLFRFHKNTWIYFQRLQDQDHTTPLFGYGIQILLTSNHTLLVSNYNNDVVLYQIDDYRTIYKPAQIIQRKAQTFISDAYNNIITSDLTNSLYLYANNHDYNLTNLDIDTCFYGSYLAIHHDHLFVSCSLYYPFSSLPYIIKPFVFVYALHYNMQHHVVSIDLIDTITPPEPDDYFATNLAVQDNHLLIVGTNTVYHYTKRIDATWGFHKTYQVPESVVNYDYKVKMYDDTHFIVGNYGFQDLQGALLVGEIDSLPYSDPENYVNQLDTFFANEKIRKMFMVFAIFFFLLLALLSVMGVYICFHTPTVSDKKKKKEEEESPYTVHSYVGYCETDYDPTYYNPQVYSSYSNPVAYYNPYHYPTYYTTYYPAYYPTYYYYHPPKIDNDTLYKMNTMDELDKLHKMNMNEFEKEKEREKGKEKVFEKEKEKENEKENQNTYISIQKIYASKIKPYL